VRLKDYVQPDSIFTRIVADERGELNRIITEILVSRYEDINAGNLLKDLNTQDRVACTQGDCIIGVPNAFVDSLPDTVCLVVRVLPRTDAVSPDTIRVGFFVISPSRNAMKHLRLIARISRFACHTGFCSDLAAIDDPEAFYQRILAEDEKHV